MSYVIQNFNSSTRHIIFTPKTKSLVLLLNAEKIFLFFKLNSHILCTSVKNFIRFDYFFLFHKYFFSKNLFLLFYKFNLINTSFYDNNLHKSFRYYLFKFFLNSLSQPLKSLPHPYVVDQHEFFENQYPLSVKTINYRLPKTYYKNIFFFFMLTSSFLWYQHSNFFKFYLNFILVNNVLNIMPFYNNYFLHVYNF